MRHMSNFLLLVLAIIVGTQVVGGTMLFVTGRLNPDKLDLIAQVMRGELSGKTPEAAASQPTVQAVTEPKPAPRPATPEVRQRELERRESELGYQRQQLALQLAEFSQKVEAFQKEKASWQAARKRAQKLMQAEGRTKVINLLVAMRAKSAKDMLIRMPADEAASLLGSIDERKASRILKEFKSDEEMQRAKEILDLLKKGTGVPGGSPSGEARDGRSRKPDGGGSG